MTESTVKQSERNVNFCDNLRYIQEVADDLSYKNIIKILRDSMYDTEEFNIRKKEFERFLSRPLKENKKFYAQSYIEVFAVLNIYTKFVNEVYNLNDPMTEKIELIMVGRNSMVVPNAEMVERLARVKKHLLKQDVPFEQAYEFDEMINALESAMCTLDCARKSFESHKDESLKIQDIIKSCDGFITFKEWLGLVTSESNRHMDDYEDLLTQFAWDDEFPSNSDSSWKSYRMLLKYIMKKWHYRFWDDFKKLYYEYQNILEGRWFP